MEGMLLMLMARKEEDERVDSLSYQGHHEDNHPFLIKKNMRKKKKRKKLRKRIREERKVII